MLLRAGGEENLYYAPKGRNNTLSSSSTSHRRLPQPSQPTSLNSIKPKNQESAMEEVWKDINLASLHDNPSRDDPIRISNFRALNFQDFLGGPYNKNPPTAIVAGEYSSSESPPATALRLNSGGADQFNFLTNSADPMIRPSCLLQTQNVSNVASLHNVPYGALASPPSCSLPAFGKKRFPEPESNSGDRRHKRMIKNRESAARSRARKQAYTNELELEVAHLMEENARLKRQQQQLYLATASQVPKKHSLLRSSTAPF